MDRPPVFCFHLWAEIALDIHAHRVPDNVQELGWPLNGMQLSVSPVRLCQLYANHGVLAFDARATPVQTDSRHEFKFDVQRKKVEPRKNNSKMSWHYFYWSEVFTNATGESLRVCLKKYGVNVKDYDEMGVTTAVLFLTSTKTLDESWLLGSMINGEPVCVKYYEADKLTYHLSSTTDLGAHILDLLNSHM